MKLIGIHVTGRTINTTFIVREQKKGDVVKCLKGSNFKYEEVEVTSDMLKNRTFKIL